MSFLQTGLNFSLTTGTLTKNILAGLNHPHEKPSKAREVDLRPFIANRDDLLSFPLPNLENTEIILSWIRHLIYALTWSVIGICDLNVDWNSFEVQSPQYIHGDQELSIIDGSRKVQTQRDTVEEMNRLAGKW